MKKVLLKWIESVLYGLLGAVAFLILAPVLLVFGIVGAVDRTWFKDWLE